MKREEDTLINPQLTNSSVFQISNISQEVGFMGPVAPKILVLPGSAQAQAQMGLSWLYSQLIQPPPPPPPPARESFFSAPAN